MRSLPLVSLVFFGVFFSFNSQAKDLYMLSTGYSCTMFTALGPARMVYSPEKNISEPEISMRYGLFQTKFRHGGLSYSEGPNAPKIRATIGSIHSVTTKITYMIFLQAPQPGVEEQILTGIMGYAPVLGNAGYTMYMKPLGNPLSSLGFPIPINGFIPTATITCRVQFQNR